MNIPNREEHDHVHIERFGSGAIRGGPSADALADHIPGASFDIARLLARRYGYGTVYVLSGEGMELFHTCMTLGFVSMDGIITSKGRRFLIRYTD